ncbi:MAG: VWA domain-containing protein [Candidatus Kapabacteria bacterium]|nr:VWA domain-containing protein [Candidatus Kapabacteria bacterium]
MFCSLILKKYNYFSRGQGLKGVLFKSSLIISCLFIFSDFALCQTKLPLLDIIDIKTNFGNVDYLVKKCKPIRFLNIGDTTLNIYYIDSIRHPFTSDIVYPKSIKNGDSLSFNICYQPDKVGRDSQHVVMRADTRLSNSIALLFDVSTSMGDPTPSGELKINAAHAAGQSFINYMLATPKIWDEAAIFIFASANWFKSNQTFTKDKIKLGAALPTLSDLRNSTAFFDAVLKTIDSIKSRPFASRVIVALTDGVDNNSNPNSTVQAIINKANSYKIRIFTVGLGSQINSTALGQIANGTGAAFFTANTGAELNNIYQKIFFMLSMNVELSFDIVGSCLGPFSGLTCSKDTLLSPGDTVEYSFYVNSVTKQITLTDEYDIQISFDKNLLYPIIKPGMTYNNDGRLFISGNSTTASKLDKEPLASASFTAMLGDKAEGSISMDSLSWNNGELRTILLDNRCKFQIKTCKAGGTRLFYSTDNQLNLTQAKPNPCSEFTNIYFEAIEEGITSLKIYNSMGEFIQNPFYQNIKPGKFNIQIDVSDYPNGMYFYVLNTPTAILKNKMQVLR